MCKKYGLNRIGYIIAIILFISYSSQTVPLVLANGPRYMIAIIATSDDPNLENNLAVFNAQENLPDCTTLNGCLKVIKPFGNPLQNPSSAPDVSFFVKLAHKANPSAKILVVEARSASWQDKDDAANYAKNLPEVERVSSVSYSKVVMEIGLLLKQAK